MAAVISRLLTTTSVKVRCNQYGVATFSRLFGRASCSSLCIKESDRFRPTPQANPTSLFSNHAPLNQLGPKYRTHFQLYRALCNDMTSLEDDINVSYDGLVKRINDGNIQLIDVREASEVAQVGQITNSIHIPLGELVEAWNLPDDKFEAKYHHPKPMEDADDIVFHCRSGVRSLKALNIAKELGYSKARHFPGGWLQWAEKNHLPSE